jgi:hypothetical protein
MKGFGKGVKVKQTTEQPTDKQIFLNLVNSLDKCWDRTQYLEEKIMLGISSYEEPLYQIIEDLIFVYYGEFKAGITLWWIFDRFDEKDDLLPVTVSIDGGEEKQEFIKTSIQLWNFLNSFKSLLFKGILEPILKLTVSIIGSIFVLIPYLFCRGLAKAK